MKTTYKAQGELANADYNKYKDGKDKRMSDRLKARRKDIMDTQHDRNMKKLQDLQRLVDQKKSVEEARDPAKEEQGKKIASYEKSGRAFGLIKKFRQENPGSRQPKKVRGAKETEGQAAARRRGAQAQRAAKYGLTSKEKKETQARAPYYSTRD